VLGVGVAASAAQDLVGRGSLVRLVGLGPAQQVGLRAVSAAVLVVVAVAVAVGIVVLVLGVVAAECMTA